MLSIYIWAMPTVLIAIVLLALIAIFLRKKDKTSPDYYSFFILGICWLPLGLVMKSWAFFTMGLVFMVIGLANKSQWKQNHIAFKDLPKEKKRLKIIITIVLGALVSAGLVAYFLSAGISQFIKNKLEQSQEEATYGEEEKEMSAPSEPIKEPTEWKIYQNRDLWFEIKYPTNFMISNYTDNGVSFAPYFGTYITIRANLPDPFVGFVYSYMSSVNEVGMSWNEIEEAEKQGTLLKKTEEINVGGFIARRIIFSHVDGAIVLDRVYFSKCGNSFVIDRMLDSGSDVEFKKMLSTFKILGIHTGKAVIDFDREEQYQVAQEGGHMPWKLNPASVAQLDGVKFCFDPEDFKPADQVLFDDTEGTAKYRVFHQEKSYVITLTQPIPGDLRVWAISDVEIE